MNQLLVLKGSDGVPGVQYSLGTDCAVTGDHRITYNLNRDLYRCGEWDQLDLNSSIWLFGCSYAQGMGVALEASTAGVLESSEGIPVVNFAQGGSSIRFSVDLLHMVLSQGYRPLKIAAVWPDTQRWPWVGTSGVNQVQYSSALFRAHSQCDQYMRTRAELDVQQWRYTISQLGIPSAELTWSPQTRHSVGLPPSCSTDAQFTYPEVDKARDRRHPGVLSHRLCAEEFQSQWQTYSKQDI